MSTGEAVLAFLGSIAAIAALVSLALWLDKLDRRKR